MAWGAINAHFRLQMVIVPGNLNARDNIANILRLVLFPLVRQHGGNWRHMFQHDDARPILPGLHNISYETTMLLSCSGLPDHRIWIKLSICGMNLVTVFNVKWTLHALLQSLLQPYSSIGQQYHKLWSSACVSPCTVDFKYATQGGYTRYWLYRFLNHLMFLWRHVHIPIFPSLCCRTVPEKSHVIEYIDPISHALT